MQNKFISIWAWIAVVLPLLLGFMFVFNPVAAIPAGTTLNDMAKFVGLKNIVYSLLLLYAVIKKWKQLLVVLLLGRGAMDIIDGLTGLSMGFMVPPYFGALITGVISAVTGFLLSRQKTGVIEQSS